MRCAMRAMCVCVCVRVCVCARVRDDDVHRTTEDDDELNDEFANANSSTDRKNCGKKGSHSTTRRARVRACWGAIAREMCGVMCCARFSCRGAGFAWSARRALRWGE